MSRTATVRDGVTTLSSAVAEYLPRTYNTLYMVRVDDADYLVPADGIRDFENEARIVFEALSQLRGPALKLAQTLSLEMGWFPKTYQDEFQKSLYQVPPLNRAGLSDG